MEAPDLDKMKDEHIQGFLKGLMVRDLRHLARSRKVDDYQKMKKNDLVGTLFTNHFMSKRDKDKFKPRASDDPLPNFATGTKGIARLNEATRYTKTLIQAKANLDRLNSSNGPFMPS
jgi:hypothetical protein